MAVNNKFKLYSYDGSTLLFTSKSYFNSNGVGNITETGIILISEDDTTLPRDIYTYSGSKKFLGVSSSANGSLDWGIGDNIPLGTCICYLVEGEEASPTVTFDLSTLNLPTGTHTIAVRGKASGYSDSAVSAGVVFTVEGASPLEVGIEKGDLFIIDPSGTAKSLDIVVDGVVRATIDLDVTIINFTIDGVSYRAIENMTWEEWCASDYNTSLFVYSTLYNHIADDGDTQESYVTSDGTNKVAASDTIITNHAYTIVWVSHGGGSNE